MLIEQERFLRLAASGLDMNIRRHFDSDLIKGVGSEISGPNL